MLQIYEEKATKIENFIIAHGAARAEHSTLLRAIAIVEQEVSSPSPGSVQSADQKDVKLVYKMYAKYIWEEV